MHKKVEILFERDIIIEWENLAIACANEKQDPEHWQLHIELELHRDNPPSDPPTIRVAASYKEINRAFVLHLDVTDSF